MSTILAVVRSMVVAVVGVAALGVQAGVAEASDAVQISGIVECNNAGVSGVYVHATASTSGFAQWSVDPGTMGISGVWSARYWFSLDRGGSYWLSVGCGGDRDRWGTVTETGLITTDSATSSCNDVHPLLAVVGEEVYGRVIPHLGWDFSGDAPYGQCSTEQDGSSASSPATIPAVGPQTAIGTVLASRLNVRADASVRSPILYSISGGMVVSIECQKHGDSVFHVYSTDLWDRITVNGVTGFVADAWIDTGGPAQVAASC